MRIIGHKQEQGARGKMEAIDIILIAAGIYVFAGVSIKFDFFWNRGRILRARNIIGDRNTVIMYVIIGIVLLGVGIWGGFFRA